MQTRLWPAAALVFTFASCNDDTRREVATNGTLTLVRERDLSELLPGKDPYEASGVALLDGTLRIVFDDRTHVAEVDLALTTGRLGPGTKSRSDYEGVTIATRPSSKTFIVKESGAGGRGAIVTADEDGRLLSTEPTDISFRGESKGLEGIAWLDDIERLLVLCEANSCGDGDGSPGHGVVKALRHEGNAWVTEATLALPPSAAFDDYSDLAVMTESDGEYRIGVLSQESSALWLGTLMTKPLAIAGAGVVYGFPRAAGLVQYCSVEGVTFIDRGTLAVVSDRERGGAGCSKAEAVHVFAIP